jgi:hypothetical protein
MDIELRLAIRNFSQEPSYENSMRVATLITRSSIESESELPIEGVLSVSSCHIHVEEVEMLNLAIGDLPHHAEASVELLPWGPAGSSSDGWWLYCPDLLKLTPRGMLNIIFSHALYANLGRIVKLAQSVGCNWVRISKDGPILETFLPIIRNIA